MSKAVPSSLAWAALCCACLCLLFAAQESRAATAAASSSQAPPSSGSKGAQARQSAASVIGTISSLVPGLITNVAPLLILFGVGALMMPALGLGALGLLRESRRSSNVGGSEQPSVLGNVGLPAAFAQYARPLQASPQELYYFTRRSFPSIMSGLNSASVLHAAQDILERVARAIDNADKRYN